ncbi:hypothetical protein J2Y86_000917 [Pseudomonas migulae]|uniref:M15 family metallopeptidase n=1 Tax=Pseudomonas migulae TaxID=78543 RepID=UPI0020A0222A|nr:M15 family metallopeptidase [Pseudomonas migulae]MCP1496210.1 hypothetical protein [Pseudomonas migulae]
MPQFSKVSQDRLSTCHPQLQALMNEVIKLTDILVIEGHRGQEVQDKAFREGKSKLKWPQGKHNSLPSLAVDIAPYPLDWSDTPGFHRLAKVVLETAESMGIKIRWGGDWNGNGSSKDEKFLDLVHFELKGI